jgi:hypothetical protein
MPGSPDWVKRGAAAGQEANADDKHCAGWLSQRLAEMGRARRTGFDDLFLPRL